MDVNHLDGFELFQHRSRRQTRSQIPQASLERDVKAVGHECHEDVGLDAMLQLMVDGTDWQVTLEILEGLFVREFARLWL